MKGSIVILVISIGLLELVIVHHVIIVFRYLIITVLSLERRLDFTITFISTSSYFHSVWWRLDLSQDGSCLWHVPSPFQRVPFWWVDISLFIWFQLGSWPSIIQPWSLAISLQTNKWMPENTDIFGTRTVDSTTRSIEELLAILATVAGLIEARMSFLRLETAIKIVVGK